MGFFPEVLDCLLMPKYVCQIKLLCIILKGVSRKTYTGFIFSNKKVLKLYYPVIGEWLQPLKFFEEVFFNDEINAYDKIIC